MDVLPPCGHGHVLRCERPGRPCRRDWLADAAGPDAGCDGDRVESHAPGRSILSRCDRALMATPWSSDRASARAPPRSSRISASRRRLIRVSSCTTAACRRDRPGRYAQRLLEIETYRMMSLLAFPLAKKGRPRWAPSRSSPPSSSAHRRQDARGSPPLLDDLTRLAAGSSAASHATRFRFDAADAYYRLIRRRLASFARCASRACRRWRSSWIAASLLRWRLAVNP